MNDFFDEIEDISVTEDDEITVNTGIYNEFLVRIEIRNLESNLTKIKWANILRNRIDTICERNMRYKIVDESEKRSQSEYKWYEHRLFQYRIYLYSLLTTERDCCLFLDALNINQGLKPEIDVKVIYISDDCCLTYSFKFVNNEDNILRDIMQRIIGKQIDIKYVTHYFHLIDDLLINYLVTIHDRSIYNWIKNNKIYNEDNFLQKVTLELFNNTINYNQQHSSKVQFCKNSCGCKISRTMENIPDGIISQNPRNRFKKFFSAPHDDIDVTLTSIDYFNQHPKMPEVIRWVYGNDMQNYERYFFKYISQLSRMNWSRTVIYRYSVLHNDDGDNVMIVLYAGDIYVPEIDDLLLASVGLYGKKDVVFNALREIYG